MLVRIEEIKDRGLDINEPMKDSLVADVLPSADGFVLKKLGSLNASFMKAAGGVLLRGHFDVDLTAPCKRCTTEVAIKLPVKFELNLVPHVAPRPDPDGGDDDGQSERAGTFDLDDVDAEPFDGKTIDLDPIVKEQVLLALPVSVVCREDCKGLCPTCGGDLNQKDCGHSAKTAESPFATLKDFKLN